jgi:phosphonate transport system substrate-binding protein
MKLGAILLLLLLATQAFSQKVVLATYQYAENTRIANINPLGKYLSDSLGLDVEVKSYESVHKLIEAIQGNEVDIALINTLGFLLLESSSLGYEMNAAAVLKVREGAEANYKTALVSRIDFPANSINSIMPFTSNSRLGLVNVGSTSGNLVPRLKMAALGMATAENHFKSVVYGGNHRQTLAMLLENKIDVCAIGSTEYFQLIADSERAGQVKLLWMSSEIPLGPVLLHNRLPANTQTAIVNHLLNLHITSVETLEAIKSGWAEALLAERFIELSPKHYQPFMNQFGNTKEIERIVKQFAH